MAKKAGEAAEEPRKPEKEVLLLTELEQIKVLADPLRIRILEELGEERTTKQVAERIGEKPTKLYHHMEALEKVGVIELTKTRQNRGTLEKYYMAVAQRFQADAQAFSPTEGDGDEERETVQSMISTIFDTTAAELRKLVGAGEGVECLDDEGIVGFVEIRAGKKQIAELRKHLREIVEGISELGEQDDDEEVERYRLTIGYFPLKD